MSGAMQFMPLLRSLSGRAARVATNMALLTELSVTPPRHLRCKADACRAQRGAYHSVHAVMAERYNRLCGFGAGTGAHGVTRPTVARYYIRALSAQ